MRCLPREGKEWKVTEENSAGRTDFRHLPVCSIDPPGCKDIDDALHVRSLGNGNVEVGVHIADVTHFVRPGTAIDKEGANRGTSTYLVDRRLDMLPGLLTTDICSLVGGVDRFAFSVLWEMKLGRDDLEIVGTSFCKSIIHSKAALAYGEAQVWIDDPSVEGVLPNAVRTLNRIAKILRKRRIDAGALTLASTEVRFRIDNESHDPSDVEMYQQKDANALVEEMMLLANISVAKHITKKFPRYAILRRHPSPTRSMFDELLAAADAAGVTINVNTSKELADSLDAAIKPSQPFFNKLLRIMTTRCMSQALYFCSGELSPAEYLHYGLASPIYLHFTSPIRRYADVVAHHFLACAEGIDPMPEGYDTKGGVQGIADLLNKRHHMAQLAGRASSALYTVIYFRDRPTETKGTVCRVREGGIMVMVAKYGIEGKLKLLPDGEGGAERIKSAFTFDEGALSLTPQCNWCPVSHFSGS